MILKWHKFFLDEAAHYASKSKDPSTQVGAVITDKNNRLISAGYNGFPQGIKDDDRLNNRGKKYEIVVHGEINAIIFAKQDLTDKILYTYPFSPCSRCASIVIQTGIKTVITYAPSKEKLERWGDSFKLSKELFQEAGVELIEYGKCTDCKLEYGKERLIVADFHKGKYFEYRLVICDGCYNKRCGLK